ncbi:hypothetical protein [Clostridium taeniosporum]|uniref:Uncharacterized protein n=1 Tax=Clostridium taeniosporum TaxID=394958 RepID=A0A1D7XK15_9CLOT|nr:hypothetical protein [Clostridium taeniosporum]AOR23662.1 hypothetical protein BGI42_07925 [Clostridium taeniosporum]
MRGRHAIGNKPFGNIHLDYIRYKDKEKDIRQIYKRVKMDYLKNENLDIDIEKVYLKERFIFYNLEKKRYYFNIFVMVLSAFLSGFFIKYIENYIIAMSTFIIFVIMLINSLFNVHNCIRENDKKYKYYVICMEVLKEIKDENDGLNKIKEVV